MKTNIKIHTVVIFSTIVLFTIVFYTPRALAYSIGSPPTDRINTLAYVVFSNRLREVIIKDSTVWWRDSSDSSEKNLPSAWYYASLSETWPESVWPSGFPLPVNGGVDQHFYQQVIDSSCGCYSGEILEGVISGGDMWYRKSSDITGSDIGNVPFIHTTLANTWGTSGPPTDGIDAISYDMYDDQFRELVIKDNTIWVRNCPCSTGQREAWQTVTKAQAWGNDLNPPPLTTPIDVYTTDYVASDWSLEVVSQGDQIWSRRSADTNNHNCSDVWRQNTLAEFFSRNHVEKSNSQVAIDFIDVFLNIYGNTDFTIMIQHNYTDPHMAMQAFRTLLAQALAHIAKYYDSGSTADLNRAKGFIIASTNNYSKWGRQWLSGIAARDYLLGAWSIWDQLSIDDKNQIKNNIETEAAYWVNNLKDARAGGPFLQEMTGYIGDTKAESNNAIAEFLSFAANLFSDHPMAAEWDQAGRCFAYHTITTSSSPPYCGITTQTVYDDDFTIDNHDYHPSVVYSLAAIAGLHQGSIGYVLNNRLIPSQFEHNISHVWDNFLSYFHWGDYTIFKEFHRGKDWGDIDVWLAETDINYLSTITNDSNLNTVQVQTMSDDILHYFYSFKGNQLRFPVTTPIAIMEVYVQGSESDSGKWFTNSLISAKGAAEIYFYNHTNDVFCRGNEDIRGISNQLCNPSGFDGNQLTKIEYTRSAITQYGTEHPDINFDDLTNSIDFALIKSTL